MPKSRKLPERPDKLSSNVTTERAFSCPGSFSPPPSKVGPTSAFDLLQSRRSMSPRESVHGRSNPPIFLPRSPFHPPPLSLSFLLRFDPGEIPRWSTVQNGSFDVDYPEIHDRVPTSFGGTVRGYTKMVSDEILRRGRPSHASPRILRAPAIKSRRLIITICQRK